MQMFPPSPNLAVQKCAAIFLGVAQCQPSLANWIAAPLVNPVAVYDSVGLASERHSCYDIATSRCDDGNGVHERSDRWLGKGD